MYRTRIINIKDNASEAADYFGRVTSDSRAMRNTANFYIRNCMTGLKKDPAERNDHENEIITAVAKAVEAANKNAALRLEKKLQAVDASGLEGENRDKAILKAKKSVRFFTMPDKEHWMPGYNLLDAAFKILKNETYGSMPAQSNQKAIRKTCESWKSYFAALKDWKTHHDKYTGRPRIPGYIRTQKTSAYFTAQNSKVQCLDDRLYLTFAKTHASVTIGRESDLSGMKYVKCEVVPKPGYFKVCVTFEDGTTEVPVPEHPERIMGIDLGLDNIVACCTNTGSTPFVVKGGFMKAANQNFNKEKAYLTGVLARGYDSKHSRKASRRLSAISRRRESFFRDAFFKIAWRICRYAVKENIEVIVIGHNPLWKQDIGMGKCTNQNFVSIPYTALMNAIKNTAAKCGIAVIVREESYTSKASLLDMDKVLTYGKNDKNPVFSGRRTKRGLYVSSDGTCLNADINGAGNILRKEYPDAFKGKDLSYLVKACESIGFRDLYSCVPKNIPVKSHKASRCGKGTRYRHNMRQVRRSGYKAIFGWTKMPYQPSVKTA